MKKGQLVNYAWVFSMTPVETPQKGFITNLKFIPHPRTKRPTGRKKFEIFLNGNITTFEPGSYRIIDGTTIFPISRA